MLRTSPLRLAALLAVLVLALAACGGGDDAASTDASSPDAAAETTEASSEPDTEMASEPMASEMASDMAADECELESVDASEGADPAEQPVATAASENPNLSTLVQAVEAADLVETLNGEGPFTVFAPANCAFEAIPDEDLEALLADTEALTEVLTFHVVQGEPLLAADLADTDSVTTVQGEDITVAPDGETLSLNDGQATVIAADVEVANGVVHVIDGVLMPGN